MLIALQNSGLGLTMQSTAEQIYAALAARFPGTTVLLNDGTHAYGYDVTNGMAGAVQNSFANRWNLKSQGYGNDISYAYAFLNKTVDITTYKTLSFTLVLTRTQGDWNVLLGVSKSITYSVSPNRSVTGSSDLNTTTRTNIYTLDITSLSGEYYIGAVFKSTGSEGYVLGSIKKIELSI